jgi:hypothetical protein
MSEHLKVPKETKQHGELNNHGSVPKSENTKVQLNKDGSFSYTYEQPGVRVDDGTVSMVLLASGKFVKINKDASFSNAFTMAYGPHGVRDYLITGGESIIKGLTVDNPYAMAAIMTGRVVMSAAKKYTGADGHGENSAASSLAYGAGVNLLKPTFLGYFGAFFKNNKTYQYIAHKSHYVHKIFDKGTIKAVQYQGKLGKYGYAIAPFNQQIGLNTLEAKVLSGGTIWYALNSHGASNGGHDESPTAGAHPQQKIENETKKHEVAQSNHSAKSIEKSAFADAEKEFNIMSYNTSDKGKSTAEGILRNLTESGDENIKKVLWIANQLNNPKNIEYSGTISTNPTTLGWDMQNIPISKLKITPDIIIAQKLLKTSKISYSRAVHEEVNDYHTAATKFIGSTIAEGAIGVVAPFLDIIRLGWNNSVFATTDFEEAQRAQAFNQQAIKDAGGTIKTNANGSITVTIDPRKAARAASVAKSDETRLPTKVNPKLIDNLNATKVQEQKDFAFTMDKIKAANIERQTGIKVGTPGNALPGQPFANNVPVGVGSTPLFRNSPVLIGNPGGNRTTIGPARNSFNK